MLLGSLLAYVLNHWVPTLMRHAGALQERASELGMLLNLGAIGAVLVLGYIMDRLGAVRVGVLGYMVAIPCVAALGHPEASGSGFQLLLFLAGFFGIGSQLGPAVFGTTRYPSSLQVAISALGYVATRTGAIVGRSSPACSRAGWTSRRCSTS